MKLINNPRMGIELNQIKVNYYIDKNMCEIFNLLINVEILH